MAIKGKGKTRSRRIVAAPPKPPVYIRRPPFWRRPTTLIVVGLLAVGGILYGTFNALHNRSAKSLKKREAAAVRAFNNRLTAAFPADRQLIPPDVYVFFQSVQKDLDQLANGRLSSALARKEGEQVNTSAAAAAKRVQTIAVDKLAGADLAVSRQQGVRAEGLTRQELSGAQDLVARSFNLYAAAGRLLELAAAAPPAEQKRLAAEAKDLMGQASDLFSTGYRIVSNLRTRLGTAAGFNANQPPG
jgi:hypothetical protein